jgi:hypothetical protein
MCDYIYKIVTPVNFKLQVNMSREEILLLWKGQRNNLIFFSNVWCKSCVGVKHYPTSKCCLQCRFLSNFYTDGKIHEGENLNTELEIERTPLEEFVTVDDRDVCKSSLFLRSYNTALIETLLKPRVCEVMLTSFYCGDSYATLWVKRSPFTLTLEFLTSLYESLKVLSGSGFVQGEYKTSDVFYQGSSSKRIGFKANEYSSIQGSTGRCSTLPSLGGSLEIQSNDTHFMYKSGTELERHVKGSRSDFEFSLPFNFYAYLYVFKLSDDTGFDISPLFDSEDLDLLEFRLSERVLNPYLGLEGIYLRKVPQLERRE